MDAVDPVRNLESGPNQQEAQAGQENVSDPEKQDRFARRLQQMRAQNRARLGLAAEEKSKLEQKGLINKYKRIKGLIRTIKVVSAAGTSVGDIFVSMWIFILTAHGELIYSKFINTKYPIANWEKWLVVVVDILILLILGFLAIMIYKIINLGGILPSSDQIDASMTVAGIVFKKKTKS